jgi:2-dehydropantoate 2-reductase
MPYTIIGAGAIGGTVGAHMIRAGHDVFFVDTALDHVAAIDKHGLTITGFAETFTAPAKAVAPDALVGPLDTVLLAVKAPATEAAVGAILPKLAPHGCVVSLQNGLNELVISRMIGAERTVGCFVNFSADYLEPGLIHYGGPGAFVLGELDGRITPRLHQLQRDISAWGPVTVTDNIFGYLWGKLGYAAMLFATALTNDSMGDSIDRNRALMVALAREVLAVPKEAGVKPLGFDGYDPDVYLAGDDAAIQRSLDHLVALRHADQKKHSGIWRDLAVRKRKTEVNAQVGVVLREGERLGLRLPLLAGVERMIHEIADGCGSFRRQTWKS